MTIRNPPRRMLRAFLWVIGGLVLLVGLLLLVVPTLDGPHGRLVANEAAAVGTLRAVVTLEDAYTTSHAMTGFACELPLLTPIGKLRFPDYSWDFLTTGERAGYRFSLTGCVPDENQARARYQITAAPMAPRKTGIRAFCADQAGVIWYDLEGSAANCLSSRRLLE